MLVSELLENDSTIEHFGVKGMHWGVRKDNSERIQDLNDKAAEHDKISAAHVEAASNYAAEHEELLKKGFNSSAAKRVYGDKALTQGEWAFYGKNGMGKAQALNDLSNNLRIAHNHHARQANKHSTAGIKLREKAAKLQHGITDDDLGTFLEHHGVKGMKWGEHHARSQARADANEFAKARAFYGEGAGTRRKKIKAKVETRMANPHYKNEFNRTLSGQNSEKRQAQATRLRKRKDTTGFVGKTARGVHRQLSGGFGPVTATAATIAAGAGYAHKTGLDKALASKIKSTVGSKSAHNATKAFLKAQGYI